MALSRTPTNPLRSFPRGDFRIVVPLCDAPHQLAESPDRLRLRGGKVVPRRFAFLNPKDEEESFTLEFDAAAGKVRGGPKGERELPPDAQDRFGIQHSTLQTEASPCATPDCGAGPPAAAGDDNAAGHGPHRHSH